MSSKFHKPLRASLSAFMLSFVFLSVQAAPNALITQGDQQWADGKLDQAQLAFEQATKNEPQSVSAHMKLAGLQLYRQDFPASIQTYQTTISLDAKNAKAWLGLGFSYLHTGKNDLSLAAFQEAIKVEPANKDKLATVLAKLAPK
jgi:cytochrome c-type biogenesis protein CcmH/NrfG